jgi:simple sugar transport system permease protein
MMAGAICASYAALWIPMPDELGWLLILIEIALAALGGMLWAALVGVLRIRMGVNEIFGGVALNALINVYSIFLISGPWQPEIGGSAQGTEPFPQNAWLPPLSAEFPVSLLMIIIVIVSFIAVMLALFGTRWGLNLKAVGKNARSALLLGVPTGWTAMSAFLVGGALAGIAGSYRVLFTFHNLKPLSSGGIGFLGLLVVLLVSNRLILVPLVSFIFAAILTGSTRLQIMLQMDSSVAEVVQGLMVLVVILFQGVREVYFPPQVVDEPPIAPELAEVQT